MQQLLLILLISLVTFGCTPANPDVDPRPEGFAERPLPHSRTIRVLDGQGQNAGLVLVDIEASIVTWGGGAEGPAHRQRLLLVPRGRTPPPLEGALAGATVVMTPARRIAVNDTPHEAILDALGVTDRLVAVGGHRVWNEAQRQRLARGELAQVGYGWHMPPTLDALAGSRPDLFLMRMADLSFVDHMNRVSALGIPVVPTFIDAEPHYLGGLDWVMLIGMLTGREAEAEAYVATVMRDVERWRTLASAQPARRLLWAWWSSSGNRWNVHRRNADAALVRDAGGRLMLEAPDDPRQDSFTKMGVERLLTEATEADCWIIRDPLSASYTDRAVLGRFRAYREGCVFAQTGAPHPTIDMHGIYSWGPIRPDLMLADLAMILHPSLRGRQPMAFHVEEDFRAAGSGH